MAGTGTFTEFELKFPTASIVELGTLVSKKDGLGSDDEKLERNSAKNGKPLGKYTIFITKGLNFGGEGNLAVWSDAPYWPSSVRSIEIFCKGKVIRNSEEIEGPELVVRGKHVENIHEVPVVLRKDSRLIRK
ncbi:MAG: hypothetical protein EOP85_11585 [Verrucomicrobiaceae bacterium]|nr:MAG: hypothetical protein EOP85_11585 [Verrucomicrobiaceae bacterium]